MGETQSEAEARDLGGGAQADRGGAARTVGEDQGRSVREAAQCVREESLNTSS
jgi:hypothetical protein